MADVKYYLIQWDGSARAKDVEGWASMGSGELAREAAYWTSGTREKVGRDDRVLFVRTDQGHRGLIGAGLVVGTDRKAVRGVQLDQCFKITWLRVDVAPADVRLPDGFGWYRRGGAGNQIPDEIGQHVWSAYARWDEQQPRKVGFEGALTSVTANRYERDPGLRAACILHYGNLCQICAFDFQRTYGDHAAGLIHVHHIVPLGNGQGSRPVDPIKDLQPVCPNCHMVLHSADPPLSVDAVRKMLRSSE